MVAFSSLMCHRKKFANGYRNMGRPKYSKVQKGKNKNEMSHR